MIVPIARFAVGVFLVCSGVLLVYRSELGRNRLEFFGGTLVFLGLVCLVGFRWP